MTRGEEIFDRRVRRQYERFPYPDIDPETERPNMLVSGHLSLMCDLIWGGKRSADGLRVLDAGCGTGSTLAAMALAYKNAEIVGVDFSETSLSKARRLAERHGLKNVQFYHLPVERLPELGQRFDFIVSSGVLHHLKDPAAGLRALAEVLDPQGAVSVMLYGKYGRTGVYMLQEALKSACSVEQEPISDVIRFTGRILDEIPRDHPFSRRPRGREIQEGKEAGIVDLLLHARDVPFDVGSIYDLCENAGMAFYRWLFPVIFNPANYLDDAALLKEFEDLSPRQCQEAVELVHGGLSKHSFFAVKPEFSPPDLNINRGGWRRLRARLTPCLAWNRTSPVPGDRGRFAIPSAVVQDAWKPLEISHWELIFLSQIQPGETLGRVIGKPAVREKIPFSPGEKIDRAVEELLKRAVDMNAVVLLEG